MAYQIKYKGYVPDQTLSSEIERVENDIDSRQFFVEYISTRKPVVIKNLTKSDGWKVSKWKNDYLKEKSSTEEVLVEKLPSKQTTHQFGYKVPKVAMKYGDFLDGLQSGCERMYMTTQELDQLDDYGLPDHIITTPLTSLQEDFPVQPSLMKSLVPQQVSLWQGRSRSGASSGLHHDFHDNLYVLLRGSKRFRIFPPSSIQHLKTQAQATIVYPNGLIVYNKKKYRQTSFSASEDAVNANDGVNKKERNGDNMIADGDVGKSEGGICAEGGVGDVRETGEGGGHSFKDISNSEVKPKADDNVIEDNIQTSLEAKSKIENAKKPVYKNCEKSEVKCDGDELMVDVREDGLCSLVGAKMMRNKALRELNQLERKLAKLEGKVARGEVGSVLMDEVDRVKEAMKECEASFDKSISQIVIFNDIDDEEDDYDDEGDDDDVKAAWKVKNINKYGNDVISIDEEEDDDVGDNNDYSNPPLKKIKLDGEKQVTNFDCIDSITATDTSVATSTTTSAFFATTSTDITSTATSVTNSSSNTSTTTNNKEKSNDGNDDDIKMNNLEDSNTNMNKTTEPCFKSIVNNESNNIASFSLPVTTNPCENVKINSGKNEKISVGDKDDGDENGGDDEDDVSSEDDDDGIPKNFCKLTLPQGTLEFKELLDSINYKINNSKTKSDNNNNSNSTKDNEDITQKVTHTSAVNTTMISTTTTSTTTTSTKTPLTNDLHTPLITSTTPLSELRGMVVWLEAGESLYLPASWFHEVTSYSSVVSQDGDGESDDGDGKGCDDGCVNEVGENNDDGVIKSVEGSKTDAKVKTVNNLTKNNNGNNDNNDNKNKLTCDHLALSYWFYPPVCKNDKINNINNNSCVYDVGSCNTKNTTIDNTKDTKEDNTMDTKGDNTKNITVGSYEHPYCDTFWTDRFQDMLMDGRITKKTRFHNKNKNNKDVIKDSMVDDDDVVDEDDDESIDDYENVLDSDDFDSQISVNAGKKGETGGENGRKNAVVDDEDVICIGSSDDDDNGDDDN